MIRRHIAATELDFVDGVFQDSHGLPFDGLALTHFSHFKHGWSIPAFWYGSDLARLVVPKLRGERALHGRPIYVISAPYKHLPTASHAIAEGLVTALDEQYRIKATLLPFHKSKMGDSSYAQSNAADRIAKLADLELSLDDVSLIPDSIVLAVDDIRMTGNAQYLTDKFLAPFRPSAIFYLHAFRVNEATAREHGYLEDVLNQAGPPSLAKMLEQFEDEQFQLCTRGLRFILESCNQAYLDFLGKAPDELLEIIDQAIIGNGQDHDERYAVRIILLRAELHDRGESRSRRGPQQ